MLCRAQGSLFLTGAWVNALPNQGTAERQLHVLSLLQNATIVDFFAKETPPGAGPEPQFVTLANEGIKLKSYPRTGRERVECKLKNTDTAMLLIHCTRMICVGFF